MGEGPSIGGNQLGKEGINVEKITRRQFVKEIVLGGAAVTGAISLPGTTPKAYAQRPKLSVGLWNHWVTGATDVHKQMVTDWANQNKVDVTVDFLGPQGADLRTIASAEYRAGAGHDIIIMSTFVSTGFKRKLEPLNDVVDYLEKKYGKFDEIGKYLNYQDGVWISLPSPIGTFYKQMVTRIDIWKNEAGIDVVDIFPPDVKKRDPKKVNAYTYDALLMGSKKVAPGGHMLGNAISETADANDWLFPLFLAYGSILVDEKGTITVESEGTLHALEFTKELAQHMPKDIYGWDDASNNRFMISGIGSATNNPPSAWAKAKEVAPQVATQLWHHDNPRGPKGRFRSGSYYSFGLWNWCKDKKAAKDLLRYLLEYDQQKKLFYTCQGMDVPFLKPMYNLPVWEEEEPPKGTLYNYIVRGDENLIAGGYPAKPEIANQIYSRYLLPVMVGKVVTGEMNPKAAMQWCAKELETLTR